MAISKRVERSENKMVHYDQWAAEYNEIVKRDVTTKTGSSHYPISLY